MIDNSEIEELMEILESHEDENQAVVLLREFNEKLAIRGKLLLNLDSSLDHEEWKGRCDQAQAELDEIIARIRAIGES